MLDVPKSRRHRRDAVRPRVQSKRGVLIRVYDQVRDMPFFSRIDPDLRALIAYVVARARDCDITLNRTRLVKLLYLIDIERVRSRREPLTGLDWVFFHYGPYAYELIDTLEAMEGTELTVSQWHDSVLYRAAPSAPDADGWNAGTRRTVDRVIDRFAPLDLNELLDYVYFHTGPMADAERGQPLDLSRARGDQPEPRQIALRPPGRPTNIERRLEQWRARNARRLVRAVFDPPGQFFDDPDDDLGGDGVRGVLRVPADSEL